MFTSISLTNFKCFAAETTFPLSKINLLTGINGRGKSSFLQALLLFKQSVEKDKYTNFLHLKGDFTNIGTYSDLKNKQNDNEWIIIKFFLNKEIIKNLEIANFYEYHIIPTKKNISSALVKTIIFNFGGIDWQCTKNGSGYWIFEDHEDHVVSHSHTSKLKYLFPDTTILDDETEIIENKDEDILEEDYPFDDYKPEGADSIFKNVQYISASRIGPLLLYDRIETDELNTIIPDGSNFATILCNNEKKIINIALCLSNEKNNIKSAINEWLSYIFDANIIVLVDNNRDDYIFIDFEIGGTIFKPTNVGFGYSYILPILLAGMVANENHTLIIENPEAHLHPKAQHRLTEFLARVASCGVQIFVESHSEHILNGLSTAVADKNIPISHSDVSILYFSENAPNTHFFPIPMLEGGKIDEWPAGFFDQADLDYQQIYGH